MPSGRSWRWRSRSNALGKSVAPDQSRPGAGALPRSSPASDRIEIAAEATGPADAVVAARVQRALAAGRGRPRSLLRHQRRPSPRQRDVRRRQLVRRRRRPRAARWWPTSSTRSACLDARDRRPPVSRRSPPTPAASATARLRARTFEICRRIAETGVDTAALSRQIFDSFSIGRVRIMGALLSAMELHHGDRLAVLHVDDALLAAMRRDDRRHRRARQPAARRARGRRGRAVQAAGRRNVPRQPAVEGRRRRARGRGAAGAAAATRTPPGCTVDGRSDAVEDRRQSRCRSGSDAIDAATPTANRSTTRSQTMDGVLLIDKPAGPTSHDVVARAAGHERRAKHRAHRHARPARDRSAAARLRPGDAAGVAALGRRQDLRSHHPPRLGHRHGRCRWGADRRAVRN